MPTEEILQHALVTLAALAASAAIFRRILGFVGTRARRPVCSCPSGGGACESPGHDAASKGNGATVHHVTVLTGQPTARSSTPPA
jgi:hypothetical protein